jgi:hypothetical protein
LEWARSCLSSYFKDDCPEHSPVRFLQGAYLESGLTDLRRSYQRG